MFVRNKRTKRIFRATKENLKHKHCEVLSDDEVQALGLLDESDPSKLNSKRFEPEPVDPNVWVVVKNFDPNVDISTLGKAQLLPLAQRHPALKAHLQGNMPVGDMRHVMQGVLEKLQRVYAAADEGGSVIDPAELGRVNPPSVTTGVDQPEPNPDEMEVLDQSADEPDAIYLDAYGDPLDDEHLERRSDDNPYGLSDAALKRATDDNPMGLTDKQLEQREAELAGEA